MILTIHLEIVDKDFAEFLKKGNFVPHLKKVQ